MAADPNVLCATTTAPLGEGRSRTAALHGAERELYRWIIEQFATHGRPSFSETQAAAGRLGVQLDRALAELARLDLVHVGEGEIAVAYPFSGRPTRHRVWIDGREQPVYAMCAIDALGIAPMLNLPVEILSRDPLDAAEVWVRIDPGDGAWWEPETAVVLDACASSGGPSFRSCCGVLNFFPTGEHALRYLIAHPGVSGHPISMPEAIAAGRTIFGQILREPCNA